MTLEDILFIVRTTGRQDVADAIIAMAKQLDALKVNSAAATDAAPSPPTAVPVATDPVAPHA